MKRLLLVLILAISGCPKSTQKTDPTPEEKPAESTDLFDVVDTWQSGDGEAEWNQASIQRIVYSNGGYEVVLANEEDADSGGHAVLLTLVKAGNSWTVKDVNKSSADYLWPSN